MDLNKQAAAVKEYLTRYREITTYIDNIKADIADYEARLPLSAAPKVPSLSFAPGGSGDNISQQERDYFSKEEMEKKIRMLQAELTQIEPVMNRLNRSLEALDKTDHMIVWNKYVLKMSWNLTAGCTNCSEGYCRKRSEKVLEILAGMIFGPGDIPVQMRLENFVIV
ncbi:MAG: RNA polymerase subunit sigma-70 [Megasphaera cerevisiae]|jgi:hypothetical protein|nr:RNA polymerase subunit sigma-70 [Megasphaera cerevisiae]